MPVTMNIHLINNTTKYATPVIAAIQTNATAIMPNTTPSIIAILKIIYKNPYIISFITTSNSSVLYDPYNAYKFWF